VSDSVIIPLPGLGTLELPRDVFERHLLRPALTAPASTLADELLSAEQMEGRTGIAASWWMTQARERRIPFHKLGRYVRFSFREVTACDAYKRRAIDDTGHRVQSGGANG
jgi:hypothetical protein